MQDRIYFQDQSTGAGQSPVQCMYGERYFPKHTISAHCGAELKDVPGRLKLGMYRSGFFLHQYQVSIRYSPLTNY